MDAAPPAFDLVQNAPAAFHAASCSPFLGCVVLGDCMELMAGMPDKSIDAVITDPPYGVTQNEWDSMPDLAAWWKEVRRICKGAVVMTAQQPFTSLVVVANMEWFKWADAWRKSQARGHLNAKVMPLRQHEDILVFCDGRVTYNPQMRRKPPENIRPHTASTKQSSNYGAYKLDSERGVPLDMSYPTSIVDVANCQEYMHPTQKPLPLMRYLVETYTNPGDVVMDCYAGSGTTLVACKQTGRQWIGIEKNHEYAEISKSRLAQELSLF